MRFEVQVLRDTRAYTRPQIINIDFEQFPLPWSNNTEHIVKLFPGWDGDPSVEVVLRLKGFAPYFSDWLLFYASMTIDLQDMGGWIPGIVYMPYSDIPSGRVIFTPKAPPENPVLGGLFMITVRGLDDAPEKVPVHL